MEFLIFLLTILLFHSCGHCVDTVTQNQRSVNNDTHLKVTEPKSDFLNYELSISLFVPRTINISEAEFQYRLKENLKELYPLAEDLDRHLYSTDIRLRNKRSAHSKVDVFLLDIIRDPDAPNNVIIKFYIIEEGKMVPASSASSVFSKLSSDQLMEHLGFTVIKKPAPIVQITPTNITSHMITAIEYNSSLMASLTMSSELIKNPTSEIQTLLLHTEIPLLSSINSSTSSIQFKELTSIGSFSTPIVEQIQFVVYMSLRIPTCYNITSDEFMIKLEEGMEILYEICEAKDTLDHASVVRHRIRHRRHELMTDVKVHIIDIFRVPSYSENVSIHFTVTRSQALIPAIEVERLYSKLLHVDIVNEVGFVVRSKPVVFQQSSSASITLPETYTRKRKSDASSTIYQHSLTSQIMYSTPSLQFSIDRSRFSSHYIESSMSTIKELPSIHSVAPLSAYLRSSVKLIGIEYKLIVFLRVSVATDVSTIAFSKMIKESLTELYEEGHEKRRRRSVHGDIEIVIEDIGRSPPMSDNVCVLYYVREKNSLKLAIEVAHVYNHYTLEEMSRTIGLEVLSRPAPMNSLPTSRISTSTMEPSQIELTKMSSYNIKFTLDTIIIPTTSHSQIQTSDKYESQSIHPSLKFGHIKSSSREIETKQFSVIKSSNVFFSTMTSEMHSSDHSPSSETMSAFDLTPSNTEKKVPDEPTHVIRPLSTSHVDQIPFTSTMPTVISLLHPSKVILFLLVATDIHVSKSEFKDVLAEKLNLLFIQGKSSLRKRRETGGEVMIQSSIEVIITDVKRDVFTPERVHVIFHVTESGVTLSSYYTKFIFDRVSSNEMSRSLGYTVLLKPSQVPINMINTSTKSTTTPVSTASSKIVASPFAPMYVSWTSFSPSPSISIYKKAPPLSTVDNIKSDTTKIISHGNTTQTFVASSTVLFSSSSLNHHANRTWIKPIEPFTSVMPSTGYKSTQIPLQSSGIPENTQQLQSESINSIHETDIVKSFSMQLLSSTYLPTSQEYVVVTKINIPTSTDVESSEFKKKLVEDLIQLYMKAAGNSRKRRSLHLPLEVTIHEITRNMDDPEVVQIKFDIKEEGTPIPANNVASTFYILNETEIGNGLGFELITKPIPDNSTQTMPMTLLPSSRQEISFSTVFGTKPLVSVSVQSSYSFLPSVMPLSYLPTNRYVLSTTQKFESSKSSQILLVSDVQSISIRDIQNVSTSENDDKVQVSTVGASLQNQSTVPASLNTVESITFFKVASKGLLSLKRTIIDSSPIISALVTPSSKTSTNTVMNNTSQLRSRSYITPSSSIHPSLRTSALFIESSASSVVKVSDLYKLIMRLYIEVSVDVQTVEFKKRLTGQLTGLYILCSATRRHRRNLDTPHVVIANIKRNELSQEEVTIIFYVREDGVTLSSELVASVFSDINSDGMSKLLMFKVLNKPNPMLSASKTSSIHESSYPHTLANQISSTQITWSIALLSTSQTNQSERFADDRSTEMLSKIMSTLPPMVVTLHSTNDTGHDFSTIHSQVPLGSFPATSIMLTSSFSTSGASINKMSSFRKQRVSASVIRSSLPTSGTAISESPNPSMSSITEIISSENLNVSAVESESKSPILSTRIKPSSSLLTSTTSTTTDPGANNLVLSFRAPKNLDIETDAFLQALKKNLKELYILGEKNRIKRSIRFRRTTELGLKYILKKLKTRIRRSAHDGLDVVVLGVTRNPTNPALVDVKFYIKKGASVVPASTAATIYSRVSDQLLQEKIGFEVLKRPTPLLVPFIRQTISLTTSPRQPFTKSTSNKRTSSTVGKMASTPVLATPMQLSSVARVVLPSLYISSSWTFTPTTSKDMTVSTSFEVYSYSSPSVNQSNIYTVEGMIPPMSSEVSIKSTSISLYRSIFLDRSATILPSCSPFKEAASRSSHISNSTSYAPKVHLTPTLPSTRVTTSSMISLLTMNVLVMVIKVPIITDISSQEFLSLLETRLNELYLLGIQSSNQRRRRNARGVNVATVVSISRSDRSPEEVTVEFYIDDDAGNPISASAVEQVFTQLGGVNVLKEYLGYSIITAPTAKSSSSSTPSTTHAEQIHVSSSVGTLPKSNIKSLRMTPVSSSLTASLTQNNTPLIQNTTIPGTHQTKIPDVLVTLLISSSMYINPSLSKDLIYVPISKLTAVNKSTIFEPPRSTHTSIEFLKDNATTKLSITTKGMNISHIYKVSFLSAHIKSSKIIQSDNSSSTTHLQLSKTNTVSTVLATKVVDHMFTMTLLPSSSVNVSSSKKTDIDSTVNESVVHTNRNLSGMFRDMAYSLDLNLTLSTPTLSSSSINTVNLSKYAPSSSTFSLNTETVSSRSSLILVAASPSQSFSTAPISATVSTSTKPTSITSHHLIMSIRVPTNIDVNSEEFQALLKKRLEELYRIGRRTRQRRSLGAFTEVFIIDVRRDSSNSETVHVEFNVKEKNAIVAAPHVASVYDQISDAESEKRLGFNVITPVKPILDDRGTQSSNTEYLQFSTQSPEIIEPTTKPSSTPSITRSTHTISIGYHIQRTLQTVMTNMDSTTRSSHQSTSLLLHNSMDLDMNATTVLIATQTPYISSTVSIINNNTSNTMTTSSVIKSSIEGSTISTLIQMKTSPYHPCPDTFNHCQNDSSLSNPIKSGYFFKSTSSSMFPSSSLFADSLSMIIKPSSLHKQSKATSSKVNTQYIRSPIRSTTHQIEPSSSTLEKKIGLVSTSTPSSIPLLTIRDSVRLKTSQRMETKLTNTTIMTSTSKTSSRQKEVPLREPSSPIIATKYMVVLSLRIPLVKNISTIAFKAVLKEKLEELYLLGWVSKRRRRRSAYPAVDAYIIDTKRKEEQPETVSIKFYIKEEGELIPAQKIASAYEKVSYIEMGSHLGFAVLLKPSPLDEKKVDLVKTWMIVLGILVLIVAILFGAHIYTYRRGKKRRNVIVFPCEERIEPEGCDGTGKMIKENNQPRLIGKLNGGFIADDVTTKEVIKLSPMVVKDVEKAVECVERVDIEPESKKERRRKRRKERQAREKAKFLHMQELLALQTIYNPKPVPSIIEEEIQAEKLRSKRKKQKLKKSKEVKTKKKKKKVKTIYDSISEKNIFRESKTKFRSSLKIRKSKKYSKGQRKTSETPSIYDHPTDYRAQPSKRSAPLRRLNPQTTLMTQTAPTDNTTTRRVNLQHNNLKSKPPVYQSPYHHNTTKPPPPCRRCPNEYSSSPTIYRSSSADDASVYKDGIRKKPSTIYFKNDIYNNQAFLPKLHNYLANTNYTDTSANEQSIVLPRYYRKAKARSKRKQRTHFTWDDSTS